MKLFQPRSHPPQPADPATFTGNATLARMDGVSNDPAVNVYRVTFEPEARTHWHVHSGPQILLVIEGRCRVQKKGESVRQIETGGVVCIEPGETHWHGASPDAPMTHIALNIDATTTWMTQVSDSDYHGSP